MKSLGLLLNSVILDIVLYWVWLFLTGVCDPEWNKLLCLFGLSGTVARTHHLTEQPFGCTNTLLNRLAGELATNTAPVKVWTHFLNWKFRLVLYTTSKINEKWWEHSPQLSQCECLPTHVIQMTEGGGGLLILTSLQGHRSSVCQLPSTLSKCS